MRLWKIPEDTHLVFRGQTASVSLECVKCINDTWFACGAQDGSLSLYTAAKKKPAVTVTGAHPAPAAGETWVNSLACLATTDLLASGSCDGFVRLWEANTGQLTGERASLNPVAEIPMVRTLSYATCSPPLIVALTMWGQRGPHSVPFPFCLASVGVSRHISRLFPLLVTMFLVFRALPFRFLWRSPGL